MTAQRLFHLYTPCNDDSVTAERCVVLLHGLLGNAKNLSAVGRALADTHHVYAFDLPNHGRSPHHAEMSFATMADDVLYSLDQLGVAQFKLLGHSLGGKVAMQIALQGAQRVSQLVVADIAPVAYPPSHGAIFAALESIDLQQCQSRAQVVEQLAAQLGDQGISQFLAQNLEREDGSFRWRLNLTAIRANYAELIAGLSAHSGEASQSMSSYGGPALFIAGADSDYIRPEHEAATRALFPAFSYRAIAGAGHWLHAEKPQIFNRIVVEFFNQ